MTTYKVQETTRKRALIKEDDYQKMYAASVEDNEGFWAEQAMRIDWFKPFTETKDVSYAADDVHIKWFADGTLNACYNCVDRHLPEKKDDVAIIWEGDDPNNDDKITYGELQRRVSLFANALKSIGAKRGDRITLYMPMIPEAAIAMLACARIGAVHSVVFGGFSPEALAGRINDCESNIVITADEGMRGAKTIPLKANVDAAASNPLVTSLNKVLVIKNTNNDIAWTEGRDEWLHELEKEVESECPSDEMNAEDPLFILYTSGSTGKPKGVLHTTGGYMVYASLTHEYVFDYHPGDIYWCTADVGWVTGHTYIVYGPLANGAITLMFEGVPNYPDASRFWEVCDKHQVNICYTAPTAIRALMREGDTPVKKTSRASLKILGSVGEPINPEAWEWYYHVVGDAQCPIVDTWWQTETGGILISPIPNCFNGKPTYATLPFVGIQPALMDEKGLEIKEVQAEGRLCVKFPWPSMARTIWGNHQRYKETYFSAFAGCYFTGDGALREANGHYRITGRVDDVIIVSGHNLGTAPIEDAINEHALVAESAIVGFSHPIKGNALYGYITLKSNDSNIDLESFKAEINGLISKQIGPIAKLDKIQLTSGLPKTRSGKIMRRILRKIANKDASNLGDISTLLNPEVVETIKNNAI